MISIFPLGSMVVRVIRGRLSVMRHYSSIDTNSETFIISQSVIVAMYENQALVIAFYLR